MKRLLIVILATAIFSSCRSTADKTADNQLPDSTKIVSLNGTVSEIIAGLGLENNIVGTDVTSNYPESLAAKPKVGHNRNINAEGVLALSPDVVTAIDTEVSPQLAAQFKSAGIRLLLFKQEFSIEGAKHLIRQVGDSLRHAAKADTLIRQFETDVAAAQGKIVAGAARPKVLFIYARGTGTLMVGGTGTQVEKVIELAGGENAVKGFADYKPLTSEALVKANPDKILLFTDGFASIGGEEGLMAIQGVKETNAGKNKAFITMDGSLLTSFGPRLGSAITELSNKIN